VIDSGDHRGLPFAIVDKRAATSRLFTAEGAFVGAPPALPGQTPGDAIAVGVGERTQKQSLRPEGLTTPAGRLASEPGHHGCGEAIVWIDHGSALAIHRLRPGASKQQRAERVASTDAQRRRASAGCVVVPEAFYDAVVAPRLLRTRGRVYAMPEYGTAPFRQLTVLEAASALSEQLTSRGLGWT